MTGLIVGILLFCLLAPALFPLLIIWGIIELAKKNRTGSSNSGHSGIQDYSGMSGSDFAPKVPGHEVYRSGEYGGGPHSVNIGGQDCEIISTPGVYSDTTRVHHQGTGYGDSSKDYDIDSRGNVTVHDKYGGY